MHFGNHKFDDLELVDSSSFAPGTLVIEKQTLFHRTIPNLKLGFGIVIGVAGERASVVWSVDHNILEVQMTEIKAAAQRLKTEFVVETEDSFATHPWNYASTIVMKNDKT